MKSLWKELDSLNIFHVVSSMIIEMNAFIINALTVHQEEMKLLYFLNGQNESYHSKK